MTDAPEPSMQLLAQAAQNESQNLKDEADAANDQDDRSSSLSDLEDRPATEGDDRNREKSSFASEEEDDTEAETERLEESPHKMRKQKIVHLGLADNLTNGDSPSAAPTGTKQPGDMELGMRNFGKGNVGYSSDVPDPTSGISSLEDSAAEGSPAESPGDRSSKKRKREEEDDTAKSLKKVAMQLANHVADNVDDHEAEPMPMIVNSTNGEHRNEDEEASDEETEESAAEDHADDENTIIEPIDNLNHIDSNDEEDIDMEDAGPEPDTGPPGRNEEERKCLLRLHKVCAE